jgi:hypothetical protein
MSYPYTKEGKNYFVVTFSCRFDKPGVVAETPATSFFESHAVQGKGKFRPGDALQHFARRLNGANGKEQNWEYAIVSVIETSREDLESYCCDFDKGRWLIDLDEEGAGTKLTFTKFFT